MSEPTPDQDPKTAAEAHQDKPHPVVGVIEDNRAKLTELRAKVSAKPPQEQQNFINEEYGFLADALVTTGDYSLTSDDLVAIWGKVMDIFPSEGLTEPSQVFANLYQRYAIAQMIVSAYVVQGTQDTQWKNFPRYLLEKGELPEEVTDDRDGLQHVTKRMEEVEATHHFFRDRQKAPKSERPKYLDPLVENFGSGFATVKGIVRPAQKRLELV